jgi:hypothetical protein
VLKFFGRIEVDRVLAVPAAARCSLRHNWERNSLAPYGGRGLSDKASELEPVSGFEPLTVRLQGGTPTMP